MTPALYIHIPFCKKKCLYCDFSSVIYDKALASRYIDTVSGEIENSDGKLSTVYIGGGTPTILEKDLLEKLLKPLKKYISPATEFTIEANPESLSEDKIALLLGHGVNRLSIGAQSFDDKKLQRLGRAHDSRRAKESVILARKKGFKNIGIDLIYGVWEERLEGWQRDIDEATGLPVTHVSCYGLSYERSTPIFGALKLGSIKALPDEDVAAMYELAIDRLSVRGFKQYEVSNFSKEGCACRHNMNYWNNDPYIGLGVSAVSYAGGVRKQNITDIEEYINKISDGGSVTVSSEKLDPVKRAKETAAIKIRTKEGIDFSWFKAHTGYDFQALEKNALKELLEKDLIKYIKSAGPVTTGVCLRRKGFLFCDTVSSALL